MCESWKPHCRGWKGMTRAGGGLLNTSTAARTGRACIDAQGSSHDGSSMAGMGGRLDLASCGQLSLAGDIVFSGRLDRGKPLETGAGPAVLLRLALFPGKICCAFTSF